MIQNFLRFLLILNFLLLVFVSCDPSGNLFLTNGFEHDIVVCSIYDYNGLAVERSDIFYPGMTFAVAARHIELRHIKSILLKTTDNIVIAEYLPEYLMQLRGAYKKKKNQLESWIFTEKGLFLETKSIERRLNFDSKKILEYYRSDEAVSEREIILREYNNGIIPLLFNNSIPVEQQENCK